MLVLPREAESSLQEKQALTTFGRSTGARCGRDLKEHKLQAKKFGFYPISSK